MSPLSFVVVIAAMTISSWADSDLVNLGCFLDVAFVVDVSGSIVGNDKRIMENWEFIVDFIKAITENLNVGPTGSHVAVVTFGNDAHLIFGLDKYQTTDDALKAMDRIPYLQENTNTTGGLRETRLHVFNESIGDRSRAPNVIILITDGVPTKEVDGLLKEADRIKQMGVTIIGVGVTDKVNDTWVKQIVTPPIEDNWLPVADFDKLSQNIIKITSSSCSVTKASEPNTRTITPTTATNTTTTTATKPITTPTMPTTTTTKPTTTTTKPTTTTTSTTTTKPTTTTTTPTTTTTMPTTTTTTLTTTTTTPIPTTTTTRPTTTTTTTPITTITTSTTTTTPTTEPITTSKTFCTTSADIVIALDSSGSIELPNFDMMKSFISDLVDDLAIDQGNVHLGLVTFADYVQAQFDLARQATRNEIRAALKVVPYTKGSTNTAKAIRYIRTNLLNGENGNRRGVPNRVIIFTDGGSSDMRETLNEAELTKKAGINMMAIGFGNWVDMHELKAMSTYPYSNSPLTVNRISDVAKLRTLIKNIICGTCHLAADIAFLLDASDSIGGENFVKEVDFVRSFARGLSPDSQVILLPFSNFASTPLRLNDFHDKASLLHAILPFNTGGSTNTTGALATLRNDVFTPGGCDRIGYPNIGILLTDGASNNQAGTLNEAMQLRALGTSLFAIGIGTSTNLLELTGIVGNSSSKNVFLTNDFNSLNDIRDSLVQAICNNVNECKPNPCRNGGSCVDLIGGYQCNCTSGYSGTRCEKGCSSRIDLSLVIDSSDNIRSDRFPKVIDFLVSVLEELEIGSNKTRVGAVQFNSAPSVEFHLHAYVNKPDVISAIKKLQFTGGSTNIADSLQLTTNQIFNATNGDRQDARNVAIVITDGNANVKREDTLSSANALRKSGVSVFTIGIGPMADKETVKGIASPPANQTVFNVLSWRNLPDIKNDVIASLCHDANECKGGQQCLNGGTCYDNSFQTECRCAPNFVGQFCERKCLRDMDVVFILDMSDHDDDYYEFLQGFVTQVVYGLPLDAGLARVGIITYSDNAVVSDFQYTTMEQLENGLAFHFDGGQTNTEGAVRLAYDNVFVEQRGERTDSSKILIVLIDRSSDMHPENAIPDISNLRMPDSQLYVVVIGMHLNVAREIDRTAATDGHVIYVTNSRDVANGASTLLSRIC